jgi:hypothetical protein
VQEPVEMPEHLLDQHPVIGPRTIHTLYGMPEHRITIRPSLPDTDQDVEVGRRHGCLLSLGQGAAGR